MASDFWISMKRDTNYENSLFTSCLFFFKYLLVQRKERCFDFKSLRKKFDKYFNFSHSINIFCLFFLFRYLKVASTTLRVISDSGNHSLLYTLVSFRYCGRFLIVLLSIKLSFRVDFMLHSRRFSEYFLHFKIMCSTVSGTLHSSQVGDFSLWRRCW